MRPLVAAALLLLAGCGGGGPLYERQASAVCRGFNDAAFAEQVTPGRAHQLYAGLGDRLARLSPPDGLRHSHDVVVGFARAGARAFAAPGPDEPIVDLRLTVGDWEDDIPRVERELPDCADSLTGTHPEIQVIR